jgi:hypothetical protein
VEVLPRTTPASSCLLLPFHAVMHLLTPSCPLTPTLMPHGGFLPSFPPLKIPLLYHQHSPQIPFLTRSPPRQLPPQPTSSAVTWTPASGASPGASLRGPTSSWSSGGPSTPPPAGPSPSITPGSTWGGPR